MAVETNGRRISRDDLQAAFSRAIGEGQESVRKNLPPSGRNGRGDPGRRVRDRVRPRAPGREERVGGRGDPPPLGPTWTICSAAC